MNSSKDRVLYHAEGMRQIGAAIAPLVEDLFQVTGLDKLKHNYHFTPGLRLAKVQDPGEWVEGQKSFDQVLPKQFITGKELEQVKKTSGIFSLDEAGHNVGCVEPNNITVNTRRLGESLKEYLISKGVQFSCGKKVS